MKHTKKLLKTAFGKKKEGLEYIQGLINPYSGSLPTLFVYSPNGGDIATDFAKWLYELAGQGAWVNEEQFHTGQGYSADDTNLFIVNVGLITDPFIMKTLKLRSSKCRIVVACKEYPEALKYVRDPSFITLEVPYFDIDELREELSDVARKLS